MEAKTKNRLFKVGRYAVAAILGVGVSVGILPLASQEAVDYMIVNEHMNALPREEITVRADGREYKVRLENANACSPRLLVSFLDDKGDTLALVSYADALLKGPREVRTTGKEPKSAKIYALGNEVRANMDAIFAKVIGQARKDLEARRTREVECMKQKLHGMNDQQKNRSYLMATREFRNRPVKLPTATQFRLPQRV